MLSFNANSLSNRNFKLDTSPVCHMQNLLFASGQGAIMLVNWKRLHYDETVIVEIVGVSFPDQPFLSNS